MALTQADYAIIRSLIQAYATAPPPPTSGLLRPGTVTTYDPGTQQVGVVVDGDLAATMTLNLTGFHLPVGQRVMVTFQPPHGAFVVGLAQPTDPLLLGNLNAAGNVAAGADITAAGNIASTGGRFLAPNGSAAAPPYTFTSDPDTGMYRVGANHVGIAAAGSLSASFTANSTRFSDGTAAAPGITFQSDTNTGILRSAADTMQFSCGGTVKMALASGAVIMDLAASATAYQPVHRDPTFGVIVRYTSSRRFKERVETFDGADLVSQLRPVTFYPKEGHGDTGRQSVGFIAEEVADVDTRLTTTGPDGAPDGLDTNAMLAALVAEVQALRRRVEALEAEVADLREGCCS